MLSLAKNFRLLWYGGVRLHKNTPINKSQCVWFSNPEIISRPKMWFSSQDGKGGKDKGGKDKGEKDGKQGKDKKKKKNPKEHKKTRDIKEYLEQQEESLFSKSQATAKHPGQLASINAFSYPAEEDQQEEKVQPQIDHKIKVKSAMLYDKYMHTRLRPTMSLDNYQIRYGFIIERLPIFVPYNQNAQRYYKNRYLMAKKVKFNQSIPKDIQIDNPEHIFEQYEFKNPENIPSHEKHLDGKITYYRQNSKYWKYTDPNITDERSIQAYSSNNVFLIVLNQDNQWVFPSRVVLQKQTHEIFLHNFTRQLFSKSANPIIYYGNEKPVLCRKWKVQNLQKGNGYREYLFLGLHISGALGLKDGIFKDYKWVPKPYLSKYFTDDYFEFSIRAVSNYS